ncbi:collagen alpha-6(VI) chain-like [Haliotis rubra]|uniref:collagen alpha-6(VI) chain-like n=1 Tax=Haliotis rubra TaxID=36100 RepID=UPI001EE53BAD|nr:collagen alpha-6(VI) chain-like [Haliotis rubra]
MGIVKCASVIVILSFIAGCYTHPTITDTLRSCRDACKQKPLDLAFVIDSSSSISPEDFTLGMWFVEDFIDIFEVGPLTVRASVVTFGDRVYDEDAFGFNRYTDKRSLKKAISMIPFKAGHATDTGAGIQFMRDRFLPHARKGVKTVCIVLTDGKSQEPELTEKQARITRDAGVEMFAVGIGRSVSEEELRNIAGVDDHVFTVTTYNLLGTIRSRLAFQSCGEEPISRVVCRDSPIDVSLVIDASSSIGPTNFTIGLDFLENFVRSFDISPHRARFSVITYGLGIYNNTAFDFDDYSNEVSLVKAIAGIPYTGGTHTDTGLGIEYMRDRQMLPKQRAYAAHIAIVMTDGQSQDREKTQKEAAKARDDGINMFAIGVGLSLSEEELLNIAGRKEQVFTVTDYKALETIHNELDIRTCRIVLHQFGQVRPSVA